MRRFTPMLVFVAFALMCFGTVLVPVVTAQEPLRHTKGGFVGCYQQRDIDAFNKAAAARENAAVYMLAAGACFILPDTDVYVEETSGKWVLVRVASENEGEVPVGTRLWGWRGGLIP